MHEHGLMKSIVDQILRLADGTVTSVTLRVGELNSSTTEHLAEHFRLAARGTSLEHVTLRTIAGEGLGIRLDSIEVET